MSDDTLKYPRGTCLVFTSGSYSAFGLIGTLVTIKDCDLPALAQKFAQAERNRAITDDSAWESDDLAIDDFPTWLVVNGYAMPAEAQTVHLGDHDGFEPEFGVSEEMHKHPKAAEHTAAAREYHAEWVKRRRQGEAQERAAAEARDRGAAWIMAAIKEEKERE